MPRKSFIAEIIPETPMELDGRSVIGLYSTARKAHEAGLAVLSAGSPYWVFPFEDNYALTVSNSQAAQLAEEVRIYRSKNHFWPPVPVSLPEKKISLIPTVAFATMLVAVFVFQGYFPKLDDLGMTSSVAFLEENAWWRLFTSMTLHKDIGHLVGNLFGISLFGYFASRYLGNGLGWSNSVACAALANLTNVLLHTNTIYLSLGASTAVFSALGLVTGFPVGSYFRTGRPITNRQWVIPFAGGLMLLGWMGSGTYPTDVAAHLWGFIYGLFSAILLAKMKIHAWVSKKGQLILLGITWLILGVTWFLAVNAT
tara:strand:+ start:5907 stop:6842 length:936 start_codon:yes stop_codon:yes gene_type:complete